MQMKYYVLAHYKEDPYVENLCNQLFSYRKVLVRTKKLEEADMVLVFVSQSFISDPSLVAMVKSLPAEKRIIPILTRPCAWELVLKNISGRMASPRDGKWLANYSEANGSLDTATCQMAEAFGHIAGSKTDLQKD